MARRLFQVLQLISLCTVSSAATQPMTLIVSPISVDHKLALSQALGQLGTRVREGYVLFGIDIRTAPEPQVDLSITESIPLGVALAQIVGQVRGYGFRAVSDHVVEVYPLPESQDPNDILNIRVSDFDVTNEPAMNIFSRPKNFIPELKAHLLRGKTVQACGSIGPGLGSNGPGIRLSLQGATVREILDAVAEADATLQAHVIRHDLPVGWVHRTEIGSQGQLVHTWSFLATAPRDWESYGLRVPHP